ncbi:MAG: hypothetical protein IJZ37_06915 [Clostridia bacterium]|nr:hypothetical protein [Clostridia bacterium]MBQ8236394.1 hypothetical protein [Clostridia bacterium]MBQ8398368.1 hypothetical protein [Clostridia bacterium]
MRKEEIATELYEAAADIGVTDTLYAVFGNTVDVCICFGSISCATKTDDLDFSVRAMNALKRAGLTTVGQVIDCIAGGELPRIRNLGRKTISEIKCNIMEFGYKALTEKEKKEFFLDVVERNMPSA